MGILEQWGDRDPPPGASCSGNTFDDGETGTSSGVSQWDKQTPQKHTDSNSTLTAQTHVGMTEGVGANTAGRGQRSRKLQGQWAASMRARRDYVEGLSSQESLRRRVQTGPLSRETETLRRRMPGVYNSREHLHEDQERGHSLQETSSSHPKLSPEELPGVLTEGDRSICTFGRFQEKFIRLVSF